jgi:L-asparaginase
MGLKLVTSRAAVMGNAKIPLTILTTGGTIEKTYDESEGSLENRETIVKNKILQKLRLPHTEINVSCLMSKDSLHMDHKDRELIRDAIKESSKTNDPIVVLHGTDTMDQTAKFCFQTYPEISVPVIFTGAMKPMGFDDSDATQNVTEAIFAARILSPGYYVTFHGKLFNVPNFKKNKDRGTFEEITL